jgi:hypothetical protein
MYTLNVGISSPKLETLPLRLFAVLVVASALGGCAQRGLYEWGGYDALLYQSYKHPDKVAELRAGLEAHIGRMEQANQRVAPGLYAELGTLYLQAGATAQAIEMYRKERQTWPESRGLMDALIANVGRKDRPAPTAAVAPADGPAASARPPETKP